MESKHISQLELRIDELTQENLLLQKELAIKEVISEISQFQQQETDVSDIYNKIFVSINQLLKIEQSREIGFGCPRAVTEAHAKGQRSCVTTNVEAFNVGFMLRMCKQVVRAHKS